MKHLIVCILSLMISFQVFANENGKSQVSEEKAGTNEEFSADAYLAHALDIAIRKENTAAVGSLSRPVSAENRIRAYQILGDNGRRSTYLHYHLGRRPIDLVYEKPTELTEKETELQNLIEEFLQAPAESADTAYLKVLDAVKVYREGISAYALAHPEASLGLRNLAMEFARD